MDTYDDGIEIDLPQLAKYRTLGICKALDIKRERFRDWIKVGCIKPTLPAMGQGTKAGFTLGDFYAIALFKQMTETGFKRELSAKVVKSFLGVPAGNPIEHLFQYLVCVVTENPDNGEKDIRVQAIMPKGGKEELYLSFDRGTVIFDKKSLETEVSDWEGMFMFNLIKLRQNVDMAIEELGL